MQIFDFLMLTFFVCIMVILVIGFNKQMQERARQKEERFKKFKKGDKNE